MEKVLDGSFHDLDPVIAIEEAYAYLYAGSTGPRRPIDLGYRRYLNVGSDSELVLIWPGRIEMRPLVFPDDGSPLKLVKPLKSWGLHARVTARYDKRWHFVMMSPWESAICRQSGIASEHGLFLENSGYLDWRWYRFTLRFADDGWFTLDGHGIGQIYSNNIDKSFYEKAGDFIAELLTRSLSMSASDFCERLESRDLLDKVPYLTFDAGNVELAWSYFVHTGHFQLTEDEDASTYDVHYLDRGHD